MDTLETTQLKHLLPALPYPYGSLEPHIDARTMTLHHDMHHASYVAQLNSALEAYPELRVHTAIWLLLNLNKIPEPARTAVRNLGGLEKLKARFEQAGAKLFGSGWVWLARTQQDGGKLDIYTTSGHGNPLMQGHLPVLVNDVWEHAYYLKHENRRGDYLKGWWSVVNWKEAARRFESAGSSPVQRWEGEGGRALQEAV